MCGFVTVSSACPLRRADYARVERATNLLRHRGPDDEGYLALSATASRFRGRDTIATLSHLPFVATADEPAVAAMGFRRLSILDLSAAGHQPMVDAASGHALVFNGEIYNYQELRETLPGPFRSGSDTEVLLRAGAMWAEDALPRLNGMFGFALWDPASQSMLLARDRFGEKQVYLRSLPNGQLWAASEIRPLLALGPLPDGDTDALTWDFLLFGLADHTEETFYPGIRQLLPGHCVRVRAGELQTPRRWYRIPRLAEADHTQLGHHLAESVRLRLRSDVPVASFLSGGLDSSAIVSFADEMLGAQGQRLRTYSSVYPAGHRYDETPRIQAILAKLRHTDTQLIPADRNRFDSGLAELVRCQEQPFHNASIFASFSLLAHIRERDGIKVILTGEGSDELLGGYIRVHLPVLLRNAGPRALWNNARSLGLSSTVHHLAKGAAAWLPAPLRFGLLRRLRPVAGLLRPDFFHAYRDRAAAWHEQWTGGSLRDRLEADLTRFNLPQLLRHLDRNSMRVSMEARVPFLDHRLVEYALNLPDTHRFRDGYSKYALRAAMAGRLPDEVVWNPTKLGFGMAEQTWFASAARQVEGNPLLQRYLQPGPWRAVLGAPITEQSYWLPVSLALWQQQLTTYKEQAA
jgi:asparagine synthase (glutamine-hydrolysing)